VQQLHGPNAPPARPDLLGACVADRPTQCWSRSLYFPFPPHRPYHSLFNPTIAGKTIQWRWTGEWARGKRDGGNLASQSGQRRVVSSTLLVLLWMPRRGRKIKFWIYVSRFFPVCVCVFYFVFYNLLYTIEYEYDTFGSTSGPHFAVCYWGCWQQALLGRGAQRTTRCM